MATILHHRSNKPLMEKKRRARINRSLAQLKAILLKSMAAPAPGQAKWEKADILEMTVQHLQGMRFEKNIQRKKCEKKTATTFLAGFAECVRVMEKLVKRFSLDPVLVQAIHEHLATHLSDMLDAVYPVSDNDVKIQDSQAAEDCIRYGSQSFPNLVEKPPHTIPNSAFRKPSNLVCYTHEQRFIQPFPESKISTGPKLQKRQKVWRPW